MSVDVCKQETREILRRLHDGDLTIRQCISMLDSAVAATLRDLKPEDLEALKLLMIENDKAVRKASNRRSTSVIQ